MRAVAFTEGTDDSGGGRMPLCGMSAGVCALDQVTGNRDLWEHFHRGYAVGLEDSEHVGSQYLSLWIPLVVVLVCR